jgi:hypothetical protein
MRRLSLYEKGKPQRLIDFPRIPTPLLLPRDK